MKIAQINSVCGHGSTGEICISLSKSMSENGIENKIYYGVKESDFEKSEFFGSKLGTRMHQIRTRCFGHHGFYSKRETYALIKKLKEFRPDIVHLHNLHGHYINVKVLFDFLKKMDCKVVWTLHDCWPITGHCVHFDYEGCFKWKEGCKNCTQLLTYPTTYFRDPSEYNWIKKRELFTSINDMTIVTVSEWLKQIVKQSYLNKYHVQRIFNGVNTQIFKEKDVSDLKKQLHLENKFVILGMAGKWLDERNRVLFQKIYDMLEQDMQLLLIGNHTNIDEKEYKKIVFIDKINNPDLLANYYNLADVFVNLSYEDTFGLVNAEAMSCGTPIISFNSTACGEVVGNDEKCGMALSPKVSGKKLYECILEIKKNGKNSYTKNCIRRVELFFDEEVMKRQYMDLYHSIYEKRARSTN